MRRRLQCCALNEPFSDGEQRIDRQAQQRRMVAPESAVSFSLSEITERLCPPL